MWFFFCFLSNKAIFFDVSICLQVHHGGAGTTAAGLKAAVMSWSFCWSDILCRLFNSHLLVMQCPTTIIPFFGDQPFWGERVHARGVGPPPIPVDEFSLEKLVDAINFMLDPQVPHLRYSTMVSS